MDRKRKWSPVKPTAGVFKDGSEDAIRRALAIRHMELPVGEFISEALTKEVPDHARELLLSNVKDEERHDLALGYIVVENYSLEVRVPVSPESRREGCHSLIDVSMSALYGVGLALVPACGDRCYSPQFV